MRSAKFALQVAAEDAVVYDIMTSLSQLRPTTDELEVSVRKTSGDATALLVSDTDLAGEGLSYIFSGSGSFADATRLAQAWDDTSGTFFLDESMMFPLSGRLVITLKKDTAVIDVRTVDVVADGNDSRTERRYRSIGSGPSWPYGSSSTMDPNNSLTGWSTSPTALTANNRYRYVTERTSQDGGTTWSSWTTPVLDGYLPEDGRSISIKGRAVAVSTGPGVNTDSSVWPNPQADDIVLENGAYDPDDSQYWDADEGEWFDGLPWGGSADVGDCFIVDDHLWQLTYGDHRAGRWIDLGQIKGDDGADAVVYKIQASPAAVEFRSDATGSFTGSRMVVLSVLKTVGASMAELTPSASAAFDGKQLKYVRLTGSTRGNELTPSVAIKGSTGKLECYMTVTAGQATAGCTGVELLLYDGTTVIDRMTVPVVLDGRRGATGATGPSYYPMGEWDALTTYSRTGELIPLVHYEKGDGTDWNADLECYGDYYYLTADESTGDVPVANADTPWRKAYAFGVVITQGLFANFAKLGKGIFSGDYFFSMNGRIGNVEYVAGQTYTEGGVTRPAYTWFKGDPSAQTGTFFEPNWWVDLLTGKMSAARGNFVVEGDGTVFVRGTVKADSLFHGICIVGQEQWGYCTAEWLETYDTEDWVGNFTAGSYYTSDQIYALTGGDIDGFGGMTTCTHAADIIIVPNLHNNSSTRYVRLPCAKDFGGKIVEVIDNAYSNGQTIGSIVVSAVDGGRFSNGIGSDGVHYSGASATIAAGGRGRFYSIYSGGYWYWLKIE